MERPNEPTLLGLPLEVRTNILQFLLCYHDTGGIISPKPDFIYTSYITLISGERFVIRENGSPAIPDDPSVTTEQATRLYETLRKTWKESPNVASGHFCSLDCVAQPPLAFVNKQLRHESLSVLYGMNRIHLELDNFELSKYGMAREVKRSPCDWWRATGDETLQYIRDLSIVGRIYSPDITYTRHPQGVVTTGTLGNDCVMGHVRYGSSSLAAIEENIEQLRPLLDVLAEKGPTVKAIEDIVLRLEPCPGVYLRRDRSLGQNRRAESVEEILGRVRLADDSQDEVEGTLQRQSAGGDEIVHMGRRSQC